MRIGLEDSVRVPAARWPRGAGSWWPGEEGRGLLDARSPVTDEAADPGAETAGIKRQS
jgi:hypothetical protein